MNVKDYLRLAADIALPIHSAYRIKDVDKRSFYLGSLGMRQDGAIVSSRNGSAVFHDDCLRQDSQYLPHSHAESRLVRKLGKNSPVMYVARVRKDRKSLAMSMPCYNCAGIIRAAKVKKVYYTIDDLTYGRWNVEKDIHTNHKF